MTASIAAAWIAPIVTVLLGAVLTLVGCRLMLKRDRERTRSARSAAHSGVGRSDQTVQPTARATPGPGPCEPQHAAREPERHEAAGVPAIDAATDTVLASPSDPPTSERRLSDRAIASLGRALERSRRLHAAEQHVAIELLNLPQAFWLVEQQVLLGDRRVPFVVVGPTGAFVLAASDGGWDIGDLVVLSRLGSRLSAILGDDHGAVQAGVCLAFDQRLPPRAWHGGPDVAGRGGWVLGIDWLLRWLYDPRPHGGADVSDILALTQAAEPVWSRRSTARLPCTPRFG